jgi:hypothetical protein
MHVHIGKPRNDILKIRLELGPSQHLSAGQRLHMDHVRVQKWDLHRHRSFIRQQLLFLLPAQKVQTGQRRQIVHYLAKS